MADDDVNQDLPETPLPRQEPPAVEETLPERLRVHTLARVLGTTSKRVLDALTELDGRTRSAQSSVDQADAIRVREALAAETETEPESRLILETPEALPVTEVPAYMPLFVAPQPVVLTPKAAGSASGEDDVEDSDDDGAGDTGDVEDTDSDDRPANRRRRRGRRGRGRGRGEQGGPDDEVDTAKVSEDDEATEPTDETEDGEEAGTGDDESTAAEGGTRRRRRRRRRKPGSGAEDGESPSPDDPPNTVVHERARGRRLPGRVPTRSRASAVPPGWRPSGSVAAMAGTPAVAGRRS